MDDDYYLVESAEETSRSASEQETRTLLYIMGQMDISPDVDVFVIDVANDVVSVNKDKTIYYSAQSKGETQSSSKQIGAGLVTLYKDYLSILDFDSYILSLRSISNANLREAVDVPIKVLHYSDFTANAQKQIRDSLLAECSAKDYVHKRYSSYLIKIDEFLEKVVILVNNDEPSTYIEKISFVKNKTVSSEELASIFKEIRVKQLGIKTSCDVSGCKLRQLEDQLNLGRNLKVETINALVLERITGMTIINENHKRDYYCPARFVGYLASLNFGSADLDTYLEECVHELYKAFCNTNLNKEFWELIFVVSSFCRERIEMDVVAVYEEFVKSYASLFYVKYLSKDGLLYLIANIMEGLS